MVLVGHGLGSLQRQRLFGENGLSRCYRIGPCRKKMI